MKRLLLFLLILGIAAAALHMRGKQPETDADRTVTVLSGPFEQWSTYEGVLDSRSLQVILSPFKGATTITWLIPEGSTVETSDLLAELDSSRLVRDLAKLRHDLRSAQADLTSLERAELPLAEAEIQNDLFETRYTHEAEVNYLEDSRALLEDELISGHEVRQQEQKVAVLAARLERLASKAALTAEFIHPTRLERARAAVSALEYQVADLEEQVEQCRIASPGPGMVTYMPTWIGGEYRPVRVGDSINQNQPMLSIPDMTNLTVSCNVPEADLSRVQPGYPATITPVAFQDLRLRGEVETVGAMAQRLRGMPAWQKYFVVGIRLLEHDDRLRTGMSVNVAILSHAKDEALLIPRAAVRWDMDTPYCLVRAETGIERRGIRLGRANDFQFDVLEGLQPGDVVVLP